MKKWSCWSLEPKIFAFENFNFISASPYVLVLLTWELEKYGFIGKVGPTVSCKKLSLNKSYSKELLKRWSLQ
jgi:hypothetical protein